MCTCLINLLCQRENCIHPRLYGNNPNAYLYNQPVSNLATANQLVNGYYPATWQNQYYPTFNAGCIARQSGYYYQPVNTATSGQIVDSTLTGNYYPRTGGLNCCSNHHPTISTLAVINCMY